MLHSWVNKVCQGQSRLANRLHLVVQDLQGGRLFPSRAGIIAPSDVAVHVEVLGYADVRRAGQRKAFCSARRADETIIT